VVSLSSRPLPAFKRAVKPKSSRSAFIGVCKFEGLRKSSKSRVETVQTLVFVLLSFSEIEHLVSCVDLRNEVSSKFFDGRFVIFVFAGAFKRVKDLVDFGTAVM